MVYVLFPLGYSFLNYWPEPLKKAAAAKKIAKGLLTSIVEEGQNYDATSLSPKEVNFMRHMDELSHALGGNTLYERDRDSMLAERANKSFDSLARLIHDTGVACNLQSYPTNSKWSFTYEPYGASDESGLVAETDQANGAQPSRARPPCWVHTAFSFVPLPSSVKSLRRKRSSLCNFVACFV